MKLGILGGTFDPVHLGHLILAQEAYRFFSLERVIFIPARIPPHKESLAIASPEDRFRMVELAITSNPAFEVSRLELERADTSYSVDTLRQLRDIHGPGADIHFLTGSDSLHELAHWKDTDEILRLCRFVIATRPLFPIENPPKEAALLVIPSVEISSSDIRQRVKEGKTIRYLVPEEVRQYIIEKRLYVGADFKPAPTC